MFFMAIIPPNSFTWAYLLEWTKNLSTPEMYCRMVTDIMSLEWLKEWKLQYIWWKEWWEHDPDYDITVRYKIQVKVNASWHDKSSNDEIEVEILWFEWVYNSSKIWNDVSSQDNAEIYLIQKWVNFEQDIKNAYRTKDNE